MTTTYVPSTLPPTALPTKLSGASLLSKHSHNSKYSRHTKRSRGNSVPNLKLSQERDRRSSLASDDDDDALDKANVRLQQAMLRRDDLLGRIRNHHTVEPDRQRTVYSYKAPPKEEYRPKSYEGPRPPHSPYYRRPPSRHSLPDMSRQVIPQYQPYIQPQVLPPIQIQAPVAPVAPQVYQVPAPAPAPAAAPVFYPETKWGKGDFMEMMMMQNAQMHQMVMNQMMLSTMPTPKNNTPQIIRVGDDGGGPSQPPIVVSSNPRNNNPVVTGPGRGGGGPAVHHHHYNYSPSPGPGQGPSAAPAGMNNVTHLPPLDMRRRPPVQPYPNEVEPLQQPRARIRPKLVPPVGLPGDDREPIIVGGKVVGFKTPKPGTPRAPTPKEAPPTPPPAKKEPKVYPFPGSKGMRKLRHTFYAAFFTAALKHAANKRRENQVSDVFIFGIHLKEAIAALHRLYLNPDGKIYPILRDGIAVGAPDMTTLVENPKGVPKSDEMYKELTYIVENTVFNITEIMPTSGVLGTHRKAVVYEMLKNGKKFPKGYFWQIEKELLQFDKNERTINVKNKEGLLLLMGVYFARGLVTTLLMKPLDYGLTTTELDTVAQRNLALLATIFIWILRKVSWDGKMLNMPHEISKYLYSDDDMKHVYAKIKATIEYAEKLIKEWGNSYVKKLLDIQSGDSQYDGDATPLELRDK
ncbi:uncharacterized protein LOC135498463 isoform X3 [Lineus longissimus]|uniref:uncharacterized protein LOC135498463 isoform X3 n=1 Tax=Lineus longissimus TaxID=88925 RepID=UPI00315DDD0A